MYSFHSGRVFPNGATSFNQPCPLHSNQVNLTVSIQMQIRIQMANTIQITNTKYKWWAHSLSSSTLCMINLTISIQMQIQIQMANTNSTQIQLANTDRGHILYSRTALCTGIGSTFKLYQYKCKYKYK